MKAALYARYSTDKQREASIDDQYRNCENCVKREGWAIIKRYKDEAMSGAKNNRPGYQQMLADAKAKAFDVLLVDDLSRLSRDDVEMKQVIRRFKFRRIRIIGVSDGFDSESKGHKIQAGMRGLMNEIYLDDLREKTHRGLTGRALNRNNCGGRSYGYRHIPIKHGTDTDRYGEPKIVAYEREKEAEQAKWVKQIFQWYADGFSPRWIANELNKKGVPSPRGGKWSQTAIYGHPVKGTGILNNALYIGLYRWNRSKWDKDPDDGNKRHRFERPKSEWIEQEMPELRIVSKELWDRVKTRQQGRSNKTLRQAVNKGGGVPKYLFSGLLKCGKCRGNFVMANRYSYGCATRINRGIATCDNRLLVSRRVVEAKLLEGIKQELFTPEAIELFKKQVDRIRAETQRRPVREADKRQLARVEKEIANIIAAIKAGILTPTTKAELEKSEAERTRLQASLEDGDRRNKQIAQLVPRLAEHYKRLVENLGESTQREVAYARTQIKALVGGEIRLIPTNMGYLEAEMAGSYPGLLCLVGNSDCANWSGSGGRI